MADGPETSDEVVAAVEAAEWPGLVEGDSRWEVSVVKFLLVEYGFLDVNHADEDFDARLADAVQEYQAAREITETAEVDAPTWEALTDDLGLVRQGDSSNRVKAVQQSLISGYGYELLLDGEFGPATRGAVVEFQSVKCIDPDGVVGPITFQALITDPGDTCD
ncbi:peptidoglycan hydrolase-like protein with peptidoglycan-binding domain [Lipingzhangella halophila]|uniref:Peptidoglycan hydrolase-like protein with peptidoglycan-binding domain n=1 Tax=Lipingzhangella halophila TaxID=1783352 RepID=A0A7W7W5W5_9ACTN|nr:peptidoglycan-binding protein [Lipingzhangella halophila]MBB4935143.1 peptidoglycan hydrolase-like protein with peptidoglycan-binding domain [Lipingzhangella halophila]